MSKCKSCNREVIGETTEAISFKCGCGKKWFEPEYKHDNKLKSNLNIPKKELK